MAAAAVLGKIGGEVGPLSLGFEGVAERSASARLDSCGERGGDVAGTGSGTGVAGQKTRSAGIANDGDSDGAKGGTTTFGCEHPIGVCPDGFLLCDVAGISADSPSSPDPD